METWACSSIWCCTGEKHRQWYQIWCVIVSNSALNVLKIWLMHIRTHLRPLPWICVCLTCSPPQPYLYQQEEVLCSGHKKPCIRRRVTKKCSNMGLSLADDSMRACNSVFTSQIHPHKGRQYYICSFPRGPHTDPANNCGTLWKRNSLRLFFISLQNAAGFFAWAQGIAVDKKRKFSDLKTQNRPITVTKTTEKTENKLPGAKKTKIQQVSRDDGSALAQAVREDVMHLKLRHIIAMSGLTAGDIKQVWSFTSLDHFSKHAVF